MPEPWTFEYADVQSIANRGGGNLPMPAFDALFIDFYGTVTSGDRQAVEDTSARVVAELGLPVSPA